MLLSLKTSSVVAVCSLLFISLLFWIKDVLHVYFLIKQKNYKKIIINFSILNLCENNRKSLSNLESGSKSTSTRS